MWKSSTTFPKRKNEKRIRSWSEKLNCVPFKTISMFLIYFFSLFIPFEIILLESFIETNRCVLVCAYTYVRMQWYKNPSDLFIPLEIVRSQNTVSFRFVFYKQLLPISHSSLSSIRTTHTHTYICTNPTSHSFIHSPRVIRIYGICCI